jgi:hypothetical protein
MTGRPDLERLVTDWLMATAPAKAPAGVLDAALERVADLGQERALGVPFSGRVAGSGWLRWAIVGAALAAAILGAIAGAGAVLRRDEAIIRPPDAVDRPRQAVDLTPQAVDLTPQAVDLTWTLERAAQDWPAPVRAEPADGAPIAFVAPGKEEGAVFRDPRGDTVPRPLAVVDIVEVLIREGCWMSLTTEACLFYDVASPLAHSQLDPQGGWLAYGIVVDNTGDGRPDLRFGIDNAAANAGGRMWLTELATGTTRTFNSLEDPRFMDADIGVGANEDNMGHIFVRSPGPVFRFYAWASAIVDGQIVATDYAPDSGWIEFRPQAQASP